MPAIPVMIREKYGQMAHQALPNILLSNASMITKSCIARFVDDGAFKGTNPALKKPSNIPEIYAKMFGRFH